MPLKRFAGLTPAQQRTFEQIATNQDGGHHPATLKALMRLGMIDYRNEEKRDELGEYQITHFFIPAAWHLRWCEWCAAQEDGEGGGE